MSETTSDLIDFIISEVRQQQPLGEKQLYSDEQCLKIASQIIKANFPKCLEKFAKGEEWKL